MPRRLTSFEQMKKPPTLRLPSMRFDPGFYRCAPWRKLRKTFLLAHPLCNRCQEPAEEVHHILSRGERPDLSLDPTNLEALCARCHSKQTATERHSLMDEIKCRTFGGLCDED